MDSVSADPSARDEIYLGVWTNWSQGKVFGATITLSQTNGSLLIAVIALFVTVVGTSFWRLGCFLFHFAYSKDAARDGLHHQRQAVLRNAANGASGLWSLSQIFLAWRRTAESPYGRILPMITFAVLTLAAFAAASAFSSRISSLTGDEVRLTGAKCGAVSMEVSNDTDPEALSRVHSTYAPYIAERIYSAFDYAQQCYADTLDSAKCNRYIRKRLPANILRNATCPFEKELCKVQDSNIMLDTGFLDSHSDFGLNAPESERFLYRRVLHCAPLVTEGYKAIVPLSYESYDRNQSDPYVTYHYGQRNRSRQNITYVYPELIKSRVIGEGSLSAPSDYTLDATAAYSANGSFDSAISDFQPIQPLFREDADIALVFLSANGVIYTSEVDDPWFAAHDFAGTRVSHMFFDGAEYKAYFADEAASPLACTQQHQFCNPNKPRDTGCTKLAGGVDQELTVLDLWKDNSTSQRLSDWGISANLIPWIGVQDIVKNIGARALTTRLQLLTGQMGALPANQWHTDVENWFNATLAYIQDSFVETATGPPDSDLDPYVTRPDTKEAKEQCGNQKIRSTAFTNFSVFGLAAIFVLGGLVVLLSWIVEPLAAWVQQRRDRGAYARLEWSVNGTLQLQRLAHEELGLGAWTRCDEEVPVTESPRDCLGVVDLGDPRHPRLKAPPPYAGGGGSEALLAEGHGSESEESVERKEQPRTTVSEKLGRNWAGRWFSKERESG